MKKSELAVKVAEQTGLSKKQALAATNAVIEGIKDAVKSGEGFSAVGFGTFKKKAVPERKALNPKTKETITVPAHDVVKFKAGTAFKAELK